MPQAANVKSDASAVLPITSDTLMQDAYQQQRQQMTRHSNIFGGGVGYGAMETKPELQPPASGGWPASSHMPPQSSSSSASYHPQSGQLMPMLPFKFGDPNAAMSSFDGISIMDYSHASEHQKLQQRHAASYQQQPTQQQQQPKDYIDVLLESAALDENLAAQSSATSWGEPNYPHNTQQNPSATGAATYALLTPQQQQQRQHQLQLSSMGGLPHHPNQRF
ncbi:hypothetical protein BBJ28_00018387 [Nothophytophthora sp. Chile5]|nr:hypothetical protein BBJ28_00018387 [Nothophytophthora sp. Chile5]